MKWFLNLKIKNKLFLTFGIMIIIIAALSIFAGYQLYSTDKKYSSVLTTSIGRQSSTAKAIADMNTIFYINLTKGFLISAFADPNEIVEVQVNYYTKMELLMRHLYEYQSNLSNIPYLTESEKMDRNRLLNDIFSLITDEYQPKIKELDTALYSNNKKDITRIMSEAIVIGNRIVDELNTLYDMVSFMAEKVSAETTRDSLRAVLLMFVTAILLVVLSIFISIIMTSIIKAPIMQMEKASHEISKGNLDYPIRTGRNDELGMLADHIGDMVDSIAEMNKVMTVMDNLDSMILVINFDYNLIYVNRSLANIYGVDLDNYKGKKCYRVLKSFDQPCSICQMPKLLPEKHTFPTRSYEFLYDDVLDAWVGGRASIIHWTDGSMVYFQSSNIETEKKKNQEQLCEALMSAEKASKAKSMFLANMSHELRTPLNVIVGLAELQLEERLSQPVEDNLRKINNAGNTLLSIVNDILDISKIESGSFTLTPVEYHVASLLNDTVVLVTSRIGEKPVAFRLNVSDDLPSRLYGDDLRVKQILNNLLSNAVKYTHKGIIELNVRCIREGDHHVWMEIDVKDTGIGIRPEDVKKLFSEYNQVDTHANRSIEGTGLGLAITKRLVENMNGDISVDSQYGFGSIFRARIRQGFVNDTPIGYTVVENLRKLRYNENKRHFASTLLRADLSYARVLVVDDLQVNLDVAAGLMRKYKMKVDCVLSGQAAIERIKNKKPVYNAIFMDHMMPEMDGIEAADIIRSLDTDYARSIPIIALTANAVVGTEELFFEHGFQAFITKPIDIMRLDSVIMEWVKDTPYFNDYNRDSDCNDTETQQTPANLPINGQSRCDSRRELTSGFPGSDSAGNGLPLRDSRLENTASFPDSDSVGNGLPLRDSRLENTASFPGSDSIEIPGINTKNGLSNCDGDLEIYKSVLRSYAADTQAVLQKIRNVTVETLPDYVIAVHGIKGSSANIGAETVRKIAAKLEIQAKNGNLIEILSQNDAFLTATKSLVSAIKLWLEKQDAKTNETEKPRLAAPDRKLLTDLLRHCEEYDSEGISQTMDILDSAVYDTDADLVAWLKNKVNTFDYSDIAERLSDYRG